MTGETLTGVRGQLSCAHEPVNRELFGGETHGHSYEVWAWFENPDGQADVRVFAASLKTLLALWDHKVLPPELATGEALARAIGTLAKCVEVEVRRPIEGFSARWVSRSRVFPPADPQLHEQAGLPDGERPSHMADCDDSAGAAGPSDVPTHEATE